MAVLNWGDLTKSQVDDETIEEAIARLIVAHNANEEAHLAVGQSLQSHKASEIIDHVAGSVVRDKLGFDRFAIDELFSCLDNWNPSAGVESMGYGDVSIFAGPTINTEESMYLMGGEGIAGQAEIALNPVWQIRLKFSYITSQLSYICQGEPLSNTGFGFKVVDGTLYAFYFNGVGSEITESLGSINAGQFYILSCEVSGGNDIVWKLDGVEVHSVSDISLSEGAAFMYIYLKNTAALARIMHVQAYHFDADYIS